MSTHRKNVVVILIKFLNLLVIWSGDKFDNLGITFLNSSKCKSAARFISEWIAYRFRSSQFVVKITGHNLYLYHSLSSEIRHSMDVNCNLWFTQMIRSYCIGQFYLTFGVVTDGVIWCLLGLQLLIMLIIEYSTDYSID